MRAGQVAPVAQCCAFWTSNRERTEALEVIGRRMRWLQEEKLGKSESRPAKTVLTGLVVFLSIERILISADTIAKELAIDGLSMTGDPS